MVLKGSVWSDPQEGKATIRRSRKRQFKKLNRRKKALKTRRPDGVISSYYSSLVGRKINASHHKKKVAVPGQEAKKTTSNTDNRGLLYANYTRSNFIFTMTDIDGNVVSRCSSGSMGFDKFSRKAPHATMDAAKQVSEKASQKGIEIVDVIFRGQGFQNYRIGSIVQGLKKNSITTQRVKKDLNTPHGGCRQKKQRRI